MLTIMQYRDITVSLPEATLTAARRLAQGQDVTFGQFVREAIAAEIRRSSRNAKTPNRADEQLLVSLRTLLAEDLAKALSWEELNERLAVKGFALREAGGGLALHSHPEGMRLCKASELGHSYGALMRRFGRPFPGHSHRWLADRLLGLPQRAEESDFQVIEPF